MFKNFFKNKYKVGMTLVELMVVISIFAIISGVTLFNSNSLNSHTTTQNLADDIGLSIRKAQSYAIGVHSSSDAFDYGYGVDFSTNSQPGVGTGGSSKSFVIFTDIDGDGAYDNDDSGALPCGNPTSENECLEILNITSQDQITKIYFGLASSQTPKVADLNSAFDLVFKRPNPEPKFCYRNNVGSPCGGENISYLKVEVSNPTIGGRQAKVKTVTVSNNGQISVD